MASHIVHVRGDVPCDVCFVGEAPGESEDTIGYPFVGPAGQLLDQIIERALLPWQVPGTVGPDYNSIQYALMNLTGCIPRTDDGDKSGAPDADDIIKCAPRLEELLRVCNPRVVVCVGSLSQKWIEPGFRHSIKLPPSVEKVIGIRHPAFMLRANVNSRGLLVQQSVVVISSALRGIFNATAETKR